MVFPSFPFCVDPPNWNQQQAHQLGGSSSGGGNEAPQFSPPLGLAGAPRAEVGMVSSIRPGSMAGRARLAKLAGQPEQALKCPRCDSTNTKFCYFNNYSLSQPRHFCKTCRRYWTRGGALRNVPVGGGSRRNKRSKPGGSSSSKPSVTSANRQSGASSSDVGGAMGSSIALQPQPPPPLMTSLHPLPDCRTPYTGLSFHGIQSLDAVDYHMSGVGLENLGLHQQIQQFPLIMGGLEPPPPPPLSPPSLPSVPSFYPSFVGEGSGFDGRSLAVQLQTKVPSSGLLRQLASVKMEDNTQELSLPRQLLGGHRNIDLIWGGSGGGDSSGGGWATGFSSFNSSSTDNFL